MGKYDFYYPKLKKKKFEFEKKILKFKKEKDENKKICFAQNALSYAAFNGCGYFYCAELEKFYTDLAKKYDLKNYNINFIPNSVLHVMTTCYNSGGHTRVVERWIKRADSNQKHSVVLLKQVSREIPELLKENIKNKNGELFIFNLDDNQIEKALKLRKLALEYEFIVLHTHMDDPVATIAFGSEKFTRPVILFNHADHMFWIGKSIADITADIRGGSSITPSKRLIKNPFFLGIPYDDKKIEYSKEEAREKLDIPLDKKIVLTIGSDFKYFPFGKISYKKSLEKLFEKDKNLLFFAIGVKKSNPFLQGLNKEHLKRIVFLGNLDYEKEYQLYLSASDVVIDSYPMHGFTVGIDSITHKIPFLSLDNGFGQLDFVFKTQGYCRDEEEFSEKILKVLYDSNYRDELLREETRIFNEEYSNTAYKKKLDEILKIAPEKHKVKDLTNEKEPTVLDDYCVLVDIMYKKAQKNRILMDETGICSKRIGVPYIFEILRYEKEKGKLKKIKLFNTVIFSFMQKYN